MAITYEFRDAANWLSDSNARAIKDLLNWRIPLLEERLDVRSNVVLCNEPDIKGLRKEKMRIGGRAPTFAQAVIPFDSERIQPDDESWREEFFASLDHEVFHNAQFQASHRVNSFSFASDFILEGGATAFEIEMGSLLRPQLTVLQTKEDMEKASFYAESYWKNKIPYDRPNWLFGKPNKERGKCAAAAESVLHRARTGYSFAFSVFSGYCNRTEKLPSDLLYTTANEVMTCWLDGGITYAPQGPDRDMIQVLSKKRGYTVVASF